MPQDASEKFRAALCKNSPEWGRWFAHSEQVLNTERIPSGLAVARELVSYLNLWNQKRGSAKLQVIRRRFGIWEATGMTARTAQGWAMIGHERTELPFSDIALLIKSGDASPSRQRFVQAHEIAHFFYAGLATSLPPPDRERALFVRTPEAERFCWAFAMEILCPERERREWTLEGVNDGLTARERGGTASNQTRAPALTYEHLSALARKYEMSVRGIISALDRMPIMDEVMCGVAVFAYKANRSTGQETGHRVWQAARPTWGHVISNQRADKQGFAQVGELFDIGRSRESIVCNETLRLNWRTTGDRKWRMHIFQSDVAYIPVDVKNEGRYVVAIWSWPAVPPAHSDLAAG